MSTISINERQQQIKDGERLIDAINRSGTELSQVCYHPQLGPIQTCDTSMVEVDGRLVRACGISASSGMNVSTISPQARAAQFEAFDRILGNHLLYIAQLRQQQRQLYRPQYDPAARCRASGNTLQDQTI